MSIEWICYECVFFQLHNIHIQLPGHNRKSVHWIHVPCFQKNYTFDFYEKYDWTTRSLYENVAEFLKNICSIDVCVQHSRTIDYSTERYLTWKFGWIPWEIPLQWICPAGIFFIRHDLLQYAVQSICQKKHEIVKVKVFFGKIYLLKVASFGSASCRSQQGGF